jgi:hypothetical protein
VSAVFALSLLSGAAVAAPVPVTIDACVAVDPEEVRRLTAIELLGDESDRAQLEVLVGCRGGLQTVRLLHATRGVIDSRSVDPGMTDAQDARNRELALAIAELLRRAPEQAAAVPEATPAPQVAAPAAPVPDAVQPAAPPSEHCAIACERWSTEFGLAAMLVHWSSGHRLLGADLWVRVPLGARFVSEFRAGGRRTLAATALSDGSIDAGGFGAAAGLGFDVTPALRFVGVTVGARLGFDWLRYAIVDDAGATYGGADAADVHAMAVATAFVALSEHLRLNCELAAGGALHPIVIRDNGQDVSGVRGMMALGAFGLAARF